MKLQSQATRRFTAAELRRHARRTRPRRARPLLASLLGLLAGAALVVLFRALS